MKNNTTDYLVSMIIGASLAGFTLYFAMPGIFSKNDRMMYESFIEEQAKPTPTVTPEPTREPEPTITVIKTNRNNALISQLEEQIKAIDLKINELSQIRELQRSQASELLNNKDLAINPSEIFVISQSGINSINNDINNLITQKRSLVDQLTILRSE